MVPMLDESLVLIAIQNQHLWQCHIQFHHQAVIGKRDNPLTSQNGAGDPGDLVKNLGASTSCETWRELARLNTEISPFVLPKPGDSRPPARSRISTFTAWRHCHQNAKLGQCGDGLMGLTRVYGLIMAYHISCRMWGFTYFAKHFQWTQQLSRLHALLTSLRLLYVKGNPGRVSKDLGWGPL